MLIKRAFQIAIHDHEQPVVRETVDVEVDRLEIRGFHRTSIHEFVVRDGRENIARHEEESRKIEHQAYDPVVFLFDRVVCEEVVAGHLLPLLLRVLPALRPVPLREIDHNHEKYVFQNGFRASAE